MQILKYGTSTSNLQHIWGFSFYCERSNRKSHDLLSASLMLRLKVPPLGERTDLKRLFLSFSVVEPPLTGLTGPEMSPGTSFTTFKPQTAPFRQRLFTLSNEKPGFVFRFRCWFISGDAEFAWKHRLEATFSSTFGSCLTASLPPLVGREVKTKKKWLSSWKRRNSSFRPSWPWRSWPLCLLSTESCSASCGCWMETLSLLLPGKNTRKHLETPGNTSSYMQNFIKLHFKEISRL